ncbi:MAG: DUF5666 domain-containing protein [Thermodesulfobacteriota bacterium]
MKLQKILLLKLFVVALTLFISHPGFPQIKAEKAVSFSGKIESIPKEADYIVVNERRVYLTPSTKITDSKGSILKKNDLKRGLSITIEAVQKPGGIFAEKIAVVPTRKIKP